MCNESLRKRGKASIRNQVSRVERPLLALEIIYHDGFQMEKKIICFRQVAEALQMGSHCQRIATLACTLSRLIRESVSRPVLKDLKRRMQHVFQVSSFIFVLNMLVLVDGNYALFGYVRVNITLL